MQYLCLFSELSVFASGSYIIYILDTYQMKILLLNDDIMQLLDITSNCFNATAVCELECNVNRRMKKVGTCY